MRQRGNIRWLTRLQRAACQLSSVVLALTLLAPARSEEVRREHLGLDLLANLEVPLGQPLEGSPVALILHGTLADHRMEIIRTLQINLVQRAIPSLAITLSLGRNARKGSFACDNQHEHRLTDAADELGSWIDWLKERNVASVVLIGHSRGAQQVAHYASGTVDPIVERLVLIAPPVDTPDEVAARYATAHSADLRAILTGARKLVEAGEEDTLIDVPGFLTCRAAKVTAAALVEYYDPEGKHQAIELLRKIQIPAHVIAGSDDQTARSVAKRMRGSGLGGHVTVAEIDGADHFFRDIFADDLADHVRSVIPQGTRSKP